MSSLCHLSSQLPFFPLCSKHKRNSQSGIVCFAFNRCHDLPTVLQWLFIVVIPLAYWLCQKTSYTVCYQRTFPSPFPSSHQLSFSLIPSLRTGSISAFRRLWCNFWASTFMCSFFAPCSDLEASDPLCMMCWDFCVVVLLKSISVCINCRHRVNAVGSQVTYNFAQCCLPHSLQF